MRTNVTKGVFKKSLTLRYQYLLFVSLPTWIGAQTEAKFING